jgi:hypothetical protein
MITTKIKVEKHLAEYAIGKWGTEFNEPVRFPDTTDLYHSVYNLTQKRPMECQLDSGNLEIVLPEKDKSGDDIRKNPAIYNYISERSSEILNRKLKIYFWCELHEFLTEQKHLYGIEYLESIYTFMLKYRITSITEDCMIKNYYRWRQLIRKKDKREYTRKK